MSDAAPAPKPPRDPAEGPQRRRTAALLWAGGFAAALVLYAVTMLPDLAWQDMGEYQWAAARLPWQPTVESPWCPPGRVVRAHPWFLMVAKVLSVGRPYSYAWSANLASALGMALAAGNIALLVLLLTGRPAPSYVAAAAFTLGHTVWFFAVQAEVLGWTAAFLTAECLCAWAWTRSRRPAWWVLLFLLNGLALSNHLMAVFSMAVFGVWVIVATVRRQVPAWVLPVAACAWFVGGTLYWMSVYLEYTRTGSLAATWVSATVGRFGGEVANTRGLPRLVARSLAYVALDMPTPLILGVPVGFALAWRHASGLGRALAALAVLFFLWAARYDVPDQYSFFVPFYALGSVFIGLSAAWAVARWGRWFGPVLAACAALPVVVYLVLPTIADRAGLRLSGRAIAYRDETAYFLQPWKSGYWGPRLFAEEALEVLPDRAVLAADSTTAAPLTCIHDIEGRRQDVLLVGSYAHLYDPLAQRQLGPAEGRAARFRAAGRRLFVTSVLDAYVPAWLKPHGGLRPLGPVYEVLPPPRPEADVSGEGGGAVP